MKTIRTTNFLKSLALLTLLFSATATFAQEEESAAKKVSISGSVDAYYQTNLSASDTEAQSFGTSFADLEGNLQPVVTILTNCMLTGMFLTLPH